MHLDMRDRLAARIYDAAIGASSWDDVVRDVALATNALQATLEVHDPLLGLAKRYAPLCRAEFLRSYREHYGRRFTLAGKTRAFALGRCFRTEEMLPDRGEALRRSAFYNEWWLPQGAGGGALYANLASTGRTTALASIYKPRGTDRFSDEEQRLFEFAVGHLIRAVEVERRLRLAKLAAANVGDSFALVDREMRILAAGPSALRHLSSAGLVVADALGDRIRSVDGALERQIASAGLGRPRVGGELPHRSGDGAPIDIFVLPCDEQTAVESRWLSVDRPAALLLVEAPEEKRSQRARRLNEEHGLTAAEAAVALEIATGAGRAAAGQRLGIGEATVRTHLSAIFDKLGVRTQAGLARLVAML